MRGFQDLAWITIAGALTFGMLLSLLAHSRRTLAQWLGLSSEVASGLSSILTLTLIPSSLVAGLLSDYWGGKWTVALGSFLATLALVLLMLADGQRFRRSVVAVVLVGMGAACLNVGSVVLMPRSFFDDNPVAATNLGFVFMGLGALVTPVLGDLLLQIQRTGFRRTLGVFAVLAVIPLLLAAGGPADSGGGELHFDLFSRRSLWLAGAVFVLYAPLEAWLSTSALPYLRRVGFTDGKAGLLLALTWIAFLGSRFAIAYGQQTEALDPDSSHMIILLLALIATVALGNLAGASRHDGIVFWMLLIGICLGPIFSSLVGFLFLHFDARSYGTVYGTVYAVGTAGGLFLTPLFRPSMQKVSPDRPVFWLLATVSLSLIGVILAAWVTR